jgi:hypothetical protein
MVMLFFSLAARHEGRKPRNETRETEKKSQEIEKWRNQNPRIGERIRNPRNKPKPEKIIISTCKLMVLAILLKVFI